MEPKNIVTNDIKNKNFKLIWQWFGFISLHFAIPLISLFGATILFYLHGLAKRAINASVNAEFQKSWFFFSSSSQARYILSKTAKPAATPPSSEEETLVRIKYPHCSFMIIFSLLLHNHHKSRWDRISNQATAFLLMQQMIYLKIGQSNVWLSRCNSNPFSKQL